ncbi:MAG: PqqD family peptide modification chaperone [Chloroflexota bacterium]
MNSINLDTILTQAQDIFARLIDDETVMANLKTDKYYGLNPVSTRIWQLLEEPRSLSSICQILLTEFDVDEAACQSEVLTFARALFDAEMVTVAEAQPAVAA